MRRFSLEGNRECEVRGLYSDLAEIFFSKGESDYSILDLGHRRLNGCEFAYKNMATGAGVGFP